MVSWRAPRVLALSACAAFALLVPAGQALAEQGQSTSTGTDPDTNIDRLKAQRQLYLEARDAQSRRQMTRYRELLPQLQDYPLTPYLQYRELTRATGRANRAAITEFLESEQGSYLAYQLRRQWLHSLARQAISAQGAKRQAAWRDYLGFYQESLNDTELQCRALQARLALDDGKALDEVPPLWNVSHSQPEACDPVFDRWLAEDRLTPEIAWQRHQKALEARKRALAAYIGRQMDKNQQSLAELFRQVDRDPSLLARMSRFRQQSSEMQDIIHHGLRRLARTDAPRALKLWRQYDAQQLFAAKERLATQQRIASRLVHQGHRNQAERLLARVPELNDQNLTESIIRDALQDLDWERAYTWLTRLPSDAQDTERWRYWRARLMEELELDEEWPSPRDLYQAVAATRSFYGFLAADKLGLDYRLLDQPAQVPETLIETMAREPFLVRARELLLTGDANNASREWFHHLPQLEREQVLAAGKLAERWGWHRQGIQAMISAGYWNDLELRFPLAYQDQMHLAARETTVHPQLLFAIARQESAFMPDARSPAGALGLMQLMPATARQTARGAGVPYRYSDLLSPDKNIALGSRYLNQLLKEFSGNRILATAAYNAGPYRVKSWLRDREQKLPFDVWIETIPFQETRGYVQNVLSYSVIYAYRMGAQNTFITPEEARDLL